MDRPSSRGLLTTTSEPHFVRSFSGGGSGSPSSAAETKASAGSSRGPTRRDDCKDGRSRLKVDIVRRSIVVDLATVVDDAARGTGSSSSATVLGGLQVPGKRVTEGRTILSRSACLSR